ncbi:MAG: DEAD/DEAH box helicase [Acinetobacter sp.]|uniref:DEAD/DEAH box helicase n=1 Tax=Acinetobacter sp. TaxID=472 RepID=UPI000F90F1FD|nr:DEAD/DEAH box helicase [Acinetobacter sp.]RUP38239.1 MAG: DEAD/DEAH box helicase [Acinetobacter sp.]
MSYPILLEALNNYRELFVKNILPHSEVKFSAPFIKTLVSKPHETWTVSEAFKLYNIIKPYETKLRLVGFDFRTVPQIKMVASFPQPVSSQQTLSKVSKLIGYNNKYFTVTFPYNQHYYDVLKKMKGSRFDYNKRIWFVPLEEGKELLHFALGNDFIIGDIAFKMLHGVSDNLQQSYETEYIELNLPWREGRKPYAYQTVGIDYMSKNRKAINADQMRLGKTIQSMGAVLRNDGFPHLVVCPKTLRLNWKKEWDAWTFKRSIILRHSNVKKVRELLEQGLVDVVITNFDGLQTFFIKELRTIEITEGENAGTSYIKAYANDLGEYFKSATVDEAHHLRNHKTTRYKCAKAVFDKIENDKYCLTGTPIVKSAANLASLLELIDRIDLFGGRHKFIEAFKGSEKEFMESKNGGSITPKLRELNIKLRSTCFIRRERHQVAMEIPEKFRKVVKVELENRKEYDHAMFSLQDYLASKGQDPEKIARSLMAEILVRFGILKQIAAKGKLSAVREWAEDVIISGEKVIIFCWYNETVQWLRDALKEHGAVSICGKIDGRDMKDDEIERNKTKFQTDPSCMAMVITYGKGGEGHTLSAANNVGMIELGWTYKDQAQAEDRAVVVGKTGSVDCYYFIGEDTIDEDVYDVIDSRRQIEKEATGGNEVVQTEIMTRLIRNVMSSKK